MNVLLCSLERERETKDRYGDQEERIRENNLILICHQVGVYVRVCVWSAHGLGKNIRLPFKEKDRMNSTFP